MQWFVAKWDSRRFAFMLGLADIAFGLDLFTNAGAGTTSPLLPRVAVLYVIAGILLLYTTRYSLPLWIWRGGALLPALPVLFFSSYVLQGQETPVPALAVMAALTAITPWLHVPARSAPSYDLLDGVTSLNHLPLGCLLLLAPTQFFPPASEHVYTYVLPTGVLLVVSAVGLGLPMAMGRPYPRLCLAGKVSSLLACAALATFFIKSDIWAGALLVLASLVTQLIPLSVFQRLQDQSLHLQSTSVEAALRTTETWSWVMLPAVLVVVRVGEPGTRLLIATVLFVAALAMYNILTYWILASLGSPRGRLLSHLSFLTICIALVSLVNSPTALAFGILLVLPPMVAARSMGVRTGLWLLALGAVTLLTGHGWKWLMMDAPLAGTTPMAVLQTVLYATAGGMAVQSAGAQHKLTRQLESARDDLQAMNEELTALNEELSAQNEELSEAGTALERLANHDPLTGLLNRRHFQECLELELAMAAQTGRQGALLYLDLDGFKLVNDTMGHRAGDAVLKQVVRILQAQAGPGDHVGRLGGDEFGVLAPGADLAASQQLASRILDELRRDRFQVDGRSFSLSASVGLTFYPEHGSTSEALLLNADMAMYEAKSQGRNGVRTFHTQLREAGSTALLDMEHQIREALDEGRFVLHFQPIMRLQTGETDRYEALIRMVGADGRVIPPGAFLPVAERSTLVHEIDRWVVEAAIRTLAHLQACGKSHTLEINLSGRAFADEQLLPLIARLFRTHLVDPSAVIFEITETAAIADLAEAQAFIHTLREMGCRFAIDDFGVGFSSFAYLRHLQADYLKIDGSFIQHLHKEPDHQVLVQGIVTMARGLRMKTIAEHVEDTQTLTLLTTLGVDLAQGYGVGRPSPRLPAGAYRVDPRQIPCENGKDQAPSGKELPTRD